MLELDTINWKTLIVNFFEGKDKTDENIRNFFICFCDYCICKDRYLYLDEMLENSFSDEQYRFVQSFFNKTLRFLSKRSLEQLVEPIQQNLLDINKQHQIENL